MNLTPDILEAAYELLRLTKPFSAWHLPDADDVEFCITRAKDYCAKFQYQNEEPHHHRINFSSHVIGRLETLIPLMAHEMIHIREWQLGARNDVHHGKSFCRLWSQVCRVHGFDEKLFS